MIHSSFWQAALQVRHGFFSVECSDAGSLGAARRVEVVLVICLCTFSSPIWGISLAWRVGRVWLGSTWLALSWLRPCRSGCERLGLAWLRRAGRARSGNGLYPNYILTISLPISLPISYLVFLYILTHSLLLEKL